MLENVAYVFLKSRRKEVQKTWVKHTRSPYRVPARTKNKDWTITDRDVAPVPPKVPLPTPTQPTGLTGASAWHTSTVTGGASRDPVGALRSSPQHRSDPGRAPDPPPAENLLGSRLWSQKPVTHWAQAVMKCINHRLLYISRADGFLFIDRPHLLTCHNIHEHKPKLTLKALSLTYKCGGRVGPRRARLLSSL